MPRLLSQTPGLVESRNAQITDFLSCSPVYSSQGSDSNPFNLAHYGGHKNGVCRTVIYDAVFLMGRRAVCFEGSVVSQKIQEIVAILGL